MAETVLKVDDLQVEFQTDEGTVRAVNGVSFEVRRGETLGIVGESGSGKSVTNLALMGLIPQPPGRITSGTAQFRGKDLLKMTRQELCQIRGDRIAMIFQDPMTALNPFLTIEEQLTEVTRLHLKHTYQQAKRHAIAMLEQVGIPGAAQRLSEYPHQFSGGMRQRVMIAMALSCQPDVLIADEPTTALDVTIQAQILDLMKELQQKQGTAIILITHDLGVVANTCHQVCVMYGGKIVEQSSAAELFVRPCHPYTLGLMASMPRWDAPTGERLNVIEGQPPDLARMPGGCAFHPRCPYMLDSCTREVPPLVPRPDQGRFACVVDVRTAPTHAVGRAAEVQHG
ncbi:MAG TPA: ABC transporter ATP-binding protein [Pirellulaceae bacterium]|nr:ABC transporter ATP-binding protein [Pirellulaceae bacterium]